MAIYKRDLVDINLETGNIHRSWLKHSIGYKDQKADHFGVRTYRDGTPVDLTGVSVQGVFLPPQGDPIAITSGNIVSGNVAEVVLPQACYNYDGQFTLAIKLVDSNNNVTGTVRIVDGMVDNTHASGTVAPTSAVPTYQEILSTYDAMIAATAAANGAIAATYSSSSTYAVGDYCIHDGGLYRCTTAINSGEAWTAAHWTAAKIGPDLATEAATRAAADSDLKSALSADTYNYAKINFSSAITKGGVTFTPDASGRIMAVGPSTSTTQQIVTDDILVQPGTYTIGCFPYLTGTGLKVQVRDYTSGTPATGFEYETESKIDFSTNIQRKIRVRVHITTGKAISNVPVNIVLSAKNSFPAMFVPNVSAIDYEMRNNDLYTIVERASDERNLNNYVSAGFYNIVTNGGYSNLPSGVTDATSAHLIVFTSAISSTYKIQYYFIDGGQNKGDVYMRRYTDAWEDWVKIISGSAVSSVDFLTDYSICARTSASTDVNDYTEAGFYLLTIGTTYNNLPIGVSGAMHIVNYKSTISSVYLLQYLFIDSGVNAGDVYMRRRTGSPSDPQWENWRDITYRNTVLSGYDYYQRSAQGANVGTKLRMMSYNIAKFNNDTLTYISAERLGNFQKMLMQTDADFIGLQEGSYYIDGSTKSSMEYLFYPAYPYRTNAGDSDVSGGGVRIVSKTNYSAQGALQFVTQYGAETRGFRYATYPIGNDIVLLVLDAHPSPTADPQNSDPDDPTIPTNVRKAQYEELLKWANGETITGYPYNAPAHTHCVICMDANSATDTDRSNLASAANTYEYTMANGGVLGWIKTMLKPTQNLAPCPLDNILVAKHHTKDGNVVHKGGIINNIEVLSGWYDKLYSDHVPIYCDVTLLES